MRAIKLVLLVGQIGTNSNKAEKQVKELLTMS